MTAVDRTDYSQMFAADGTVLFEKILDAGERYVVPPTDEPPLLRAGESGAAVQDSPPWVTSKWSD